MEILKKVRQATNALLKKKSEDLAALGPMIFDDAWAVVREKIESVLADGNHSQPILVLRLSDGTYEPVKIDSWPHDVREYVLVGLIATATPLIGERRIVGAVVFSEAYAASMPPQGGFKNNELGEGEVSGSREVLLAAMLDGLIDFAEMHTATIERPVDGKPHLGDWEHNFAVDGDLINGLTMGAVMHNLSLMGVTLNMVAEAERMAGVN